ncbi:MAG: response regulator [Rhizobiales bacterium]|nr:response regulator [Hyphomicrobiales bacterium]
MNDRPGNAAGGLEDRHVLVVDDDARLLDLLRRFLADNGYHVSIAGNAEEARAALRNFAFDLMVLDVMMPGQDGISFTGELRASIDLPILLLTARGETEDRISGLAAGADDYLVKPFDPRELLLRIATILRRTAAPGQEDLVQRHVRFGDFTFDLGRQQLTRAGEPVHLTTAELSLLTILARQPGTPVDRRDLSEQSRISGSDRAVDTQIARLRRKLEQDPRRPRYLLTMRGAGYVLRTGG